MPIQKRRRATENVLPGAVGELEKSRRLELAAEQLARIRFMRLCSVGSKFVPFAEEVLGLKLTEAQREVSGFLFDGEQPSDKYKNVAFGGFSGEAPEGSRRTALAICGRGSGKTSVLVAGRALHLALTVDLSPLAVGESGLVPLVGPDIRASSHSLSFVKGFFTASPFLARLLQVESTQTVVRITRPDGRRVNIEARAASGGGKAVRGPSLAGVMLDEAAFFYGEGYEVSDVEIYRAAVPRLLPGAQIVLATTPWAQSGLVWELFRDNFGKPTSAVCARAPTLVMRPSKETQHDYENALTADPDNAKREYDAEFLSADSERFFPEAVIERSVDRTLVIPGDAPTGSTVRVGADFAFASDSSSLVAFLEAGPQLRMVSLLERRPAPGLPLVPSEVVGEFAGEVHRLGARIVIADGHYRESIQEHLTDAGLALVDAPYPPAASFVLARSLMAQGQVAIPPHPRLLAQLRRVRSTQKPGGVVTIQQPRARDGGHGDVVSAMVCALSGVTATATRPDPPPANRMEAMARQEKAAQAKRLTDNEKKQRQRDRPMLGWLRRQLGNDTWRNLTR